MPTFFLAIYTMLILVRPMDWWEPILGWEIVTVVAILTFLTALPNILQEGPLLWKRVAELKMGAGWVIGATFSYAFWMEGMYSVFEEIGKIIIYFALIILLVRSPHGYRIFLWTVLLCTIWMAIHAILQIHTGFGFGSQPPLWRVRDRETEEGVWQAVAFGVFEDPNDLCLLFIVAVPLFYAELRAAPNPLVKGLAVAGIPLVGYGAWLTNSRGGYLGIFAMVSAYLISRFKGWRRWFLLAGSIFFLTVVAPSRFAAGLIGQQDRSILWGDGIAMFKQHPVCGVGFYDFETFSSEHKVAHNTYIHVLATTGLTGYLPFFMMIYFSVLHLRRAMNLDNLLTRTDAFQMAGLFSATVGYLTSIYFLSRHRTHLPYIMFALISVKAIGVCRTPEMFAKVFAQSAKEYRWAVVWALGSIIFMWITIRIANAA